MPALALFALVGGAAGLWFGAGDLALLTPSFTLAGCLAVWFRGAAAVVWLACFWGASFTGHSWVQGRLAPELENRDLLVAGEVIDLPADTGQGQRFLVEAAAGELGPQAMRLLLTMYADPDAAESVRLPAIRAGERWQFPVRLKRPHGWVNPGLYDRQLRLFVTDVHATGYVRAGSGLLRPLPASGFSVQAYRHELRDVIDDKLRNTAVTGLAVAVALGDRSMLGERQQDILRVTGTTHLLAISGLHIGMVAGFGWVLGAAIYRVLPGPARSSGWGWRAALAVSFAATYSTLAGFAIATQRALLMLLMVLVLRLTGRVSKLGAALAWAITLLLVIDGRHLLDIGFWLSSGAVAVIGLALSGARASGFASRLASAARLQVFLSVAMLLPGVMWFGGVSAVGLLANLMAIPMFGLIVMPLLLGGLALSLMGGGELLLNTGASSLGLLLTALEWLAGWPAAWLALPSLQPLPVTLFVAGVLLLLGLWPRWPLPGIGCLLTGLVCLAPPERPGVTIQILDVGQGLAVLVTQGERAALFDTGAAWLDGDTAQRVILPTLYQRGYQSLDVLIISHLDNDHAGGAATLRKQLPIDLVYGPPLLQQQFPQAQTCRTGVRWQWGATEFEFLHPRTHRGWSENNASCVLRLRAYGREVLLTGDIERDAERVLLARRNLGPANVVIAPHHGSRSSSGVELVSALRPDYVVFPVGYRNRWGFPHPEVRARWAGAGACAVETSATGSVSFELRADQPLQPVFAAASWRRPWPVRAAAEGLCDSGVPL